MKIFITILIFLPYLAFSQHDNPPEAPLHYTADFRLNELELSKRSAIKKVFKWYNKIKTSEPLEYHKRQGVLKWQDSIDFKPKEESDSLFTGKVSYQIEILIDDSICHYSMQNIVHEGKTSLGLLRTNKRHPYLDRGPHVIVESSGGGWEYMIGREYDKNWRYVKFLINLVDRWNRNAVLRSLSDEAEIIP